MSNMWEKSAQIILVGFGSQMCSAISFWCVFTVLVETPSLIFLLPVSWITGSDGQNSIRQYQGHLVFFIGSLPWILWLGGLAIDQVGTLVRKFEVSNWSYRNKSGSHGFELTWRETDTSSRFSPWSLWYVDKSDACSWVSQLYQNLSILFCQSTFFLIFWW